MFKLAQVPILYAVVSQWSKEGSGVEPNTSSPSPPEVSHPSPSSVYSMGLGSSPRIEEPEGWWVSPAVSPLISWIEDSYPSRPKSGGESLPSASVDSSETSWSVLEASDGIASSDLLHSCVSFSGREKRHWLITESVPLFLSAGTAEMPGLGELSEGSPPTRASWLLCGSDFSPDFVLCILYIYLFFYVIHITFFSLIYYNVIHHSVFNVQKTKCKY